MLSRSRLFFYCMGMPVQFHDTGFSDSVAFDEQWRPLMEKPPPVRASILGPYNNPYCGKVFW